MNNQSSNMINSNNPPKISAILKEIISNRRDEINEWFLNKSNNAKPFFYNSVDLRNSGFKLAPVDTNLFPAGFNNLNDREFQNAIEVTKKYFERFYPEVKNILIIGENHTRNLHYLENLYYLCEIVQGAGFDVTLTNLSVTDNNTEDKLKTFSGKELTFEKVTNNNGIITNQSNKLIDFIVVNNDMTDGLPPILENLKTPISPPKGFGWYRRRKTSHFDSYNQLAREFCHDFDIDPWLITTYFKHCGVVDFKDKKGIECVAIAVDKTISLIQNKYDEYSIKEKPYVFIKSDKGTYGMGIMTASSGDEIFEMGKKIRNKMNKIKDGVQNSEVIIQEGVPTIDVVNGNPAEPMIYMIGGENVGCIYRTNNEKNSYDNLNARGMGFVSIENHSSDKKICESFSIITRLAAHAAVRECYEPSYII